MKVNSKVLFVISMCVLVGLTAEAQNRKMELSSTLGFGLSFEELGTPYEEFGNAIHLGFNLYAKGDQLFKGDAQLSINYSGGNQLSSSILAVNALYGGRYYFTSPEEEVSFFANALIGGMYTLEEGDDYTESLFRFGYSFGCFLGLNRFIVGTSIESYNNFIFKVGYTF